MFFHVSITCLTYFVDICHSCLLLIWKFYSIYALTFDAFHDSYILQNYSYASIYRMLADVSLGKIAWIGVTA